MAYFASRVRTIQREKDRPFRPTSSTLESKRSFAVSTTEKLQGPSDDCFRGRFQTARDVTIVPDPATDGSLFGEGFSVYLYRLSSKWI